MPNKPWRMFLLLLSVVLIALISGLIVKSMIMKELEHSLAAERLDLVRVITSDIGMIVQVGSFLTAGLVLVSILLLSRTRDDRSRKPATMLVGSREKAHEGPLSHKKDNGSTEAVKASLRHDELVLSVTAPEAAAPEDVPDEPMDPDDEDMQQNPGDADRITRIVKGLDDLARAQALRTSMQNQPLSLAAHLKDIMDKTQASVRDKVIAFDLECGPDIILSIDPECLEGIMVNLLDNAVKAVRKEGAIRVRGAVESDHMVIEVTDTGTGIRKKNVPHLFERFYRGSGNGIGLGLTIAQELAAACKGTIDVRTAWGKGSSFIVRIPVA
jgi:signal transduction histidine kinase